MLVYLKQDTFLLEVLIGRTLEEAGGGIEAFPLLLRGHVAEDAHAGQVRDATVEGTVARIELFAVCVGRKERKYVVPELDFSEASYFHFWLFSKVLKRIVKLYECSSDS